MTTITEADKQEACDRANATLCHVVWHPISVDWSHGFAAAAAQACAELREKDEAAHARAVEVWKVMREAIGRAKAFELSASWLEEAFKPFALPEPDPDLWEGLDDYLDSCFWRQARDTAARLGLKLVKDDSNG